MLRYLFTGCPPKLAPYQIVHLIKGASSRILRQEFPELLKLPSLWTRSYFVSTDRTLTTRRRLGEAYRALARSPDFFTECAATKLNY